MKVYKVYTAKDELCGTFRSMHEAKERLEYECEPEMYIISSMLCSCGSAEDVEERFDAYNITTGHWCSRCYNGGEYPYRKDTYFDASYAGERLE